METGNVEESVHFIKRNLELVTKNTQHLAFSRDSAHLYVGYRGKAEYTNSAVAAEAGRKRQRSEAESAATGREQQQSGQRSIILMLVWEY